MNILIHIPNTGQEWGGIRQYEISLLQTLTSDIRNHYFIYHDSIDQEVSKVYEQIPNVSIIKTVTFFKKRTSLFSFHKKRKETTEGRDLALEKFCITNRIDVIHSPYQFIPHVSGIGLIVTMHDVQELLFPSFFTAEERAYRAVHYLDSIRRADVIIVSYAHVRNDIVKYFGTDPLKIKVLPININNLWVNRFTIPLKHQVDFVAPFKKFLFYPANAWEHKNHLALLKAIIHLKVNECVVVNIVFTGNFETEFGKKIKDFVATNGLAWQVNFAGILSEHELVEVYRSTAGVVIPTLYEAGSFPLMESFVLGIPVICSAVTSLPETIGNSEFVFDPGDILSIANIIRRLYNEPKYRELAIRNSIERGNSLKQNNHLETVLNIYSEFDK